MEYCFEGIEHPSTNDCIVWILHINNVEDNLFCPCVVNVVEGDRHGYLVERHNLSSSETTKGVCCIMYLVIWLLHLHESLCENDIRCTACVHQDIVDQKSLDDIRYDHCIVVSIIFKLKVFLREGDWNMRPHGLDEGVHLFPNWKAKQLIFAHLFAGMRIEKFDALCRDFAEEYQHLLRPKGETLKFRTEGFPL